MSSKPLDSAPPLQHVIVVGGTAREWEVLADDQWADRIAELGKVADHVGARWLVLRPLSGSAADGAPVRTQTVGGCIVEAQPDGDGRERFVRAAATLQVGGKPITEAAIDALLNAPAEVDPDLVVIVGADHRMPVSLVWELAYSELVYVDTSWQEFSAVHLDDAIASYASRHRRFGGID
ncbi:MAG: undecaprenyl diphosphate synthase family protein [Actinomycetia bacterium]|nr:undecaprenyl diphosphate synthase family protein [Actinomycetes bacterium]